MSKYEFEKEATIANQLYEAIANALPAVSSLRKCETAVLVINVLANMTPQEIMRLGIAVGEYSTLSKYEKTEVLSSLRSKVAELRIG